MLADYNIMNSLHFCLLSAAEILVFKCVSHLG